MHPWLCIVMVLTSVVLASVSRADGRRTFWRIGRLDGTGAEFGGWPDGARRMQEMVPLGRLTFAVGESAVAEWPFIHPSSADTAWAPAREYHYVARFKADGPSRGILVLRIALEDSHEGLASTLHVRLNGAAEVRRKLPLGRGRLYYGDTHGQPAELFIPLDGSSLLSGMNELDIWLTDGSWCAYDALELFEVTMLTTLPERPEVRSHGLTANVFPLHRDGVLNMAEARGMLAHVQDGWLKLASIDAHGTLVLRPVLPDGLIRIDFDAVVEHGSLALSANTPNGYGPLWALTITPEAARLGAHEVRLPVSGLRHIAVEQSLTTVTARITGNGATAVIREARPRAATLQWEIRAGEAGVIAALTNVTWTEPVLVGTLEHGARELVCSTRHPVGPLQVRVTELDRGGLVRATATTTWSVGETDCAVPLSGGATRLRLTLEAGPASIESEVPVQRRTEAPGGLPSRGAFVRGSTGDLWVGNEAFAAHVGRDGVDSLVERRTGRTLADAPYFYRICDGPFSPLTVAVRHERDGAMLTIGGRQGDVDFQHILRFPTGGTYFEESLETRNGGDGPADLSRLRCGFVREVVRDGAVVPELANTRFIAVPLRHDPLEPTGSDEDFEALQMLSEQGAYRDIGHAEGARARTAMKGSEGWLLQDRDGGVLVLTYCNEHLAWSVMGPDQTGDRGRLVLGGFGTWHGDPEEAGWLPPGATYRWGLTRWYGYRGDMRQGYYTFRRFMDEQGHGLPRNFNPPVHWNEIYDNKLWWGPDTPETRAKHYRLEDMLWEASKAKEAHCEALYLDPGWDTSFGTHIWDAARLGPLDVFCSRMREEFGLSVSLHTPLADWASAGGAGATYPPSAWRVDRAGQVLAHRLCSGSRAYVQEEARRLIELCRQGVKYLMFDGSSPTGPCYSHDHGHAVPYTRDDHARAIAEIARLVRAEHPDVIIEQHDQVTAGRPIAYCPHYYQHDVRTWTERWGYEFMWGPLHDVLTGRAVSLYYYNLAYSLPMYLHIDLRPDDEHCLAFWWFASTCRHLGIGGTHADGHGWEPVKRAMALYRQLEQFFKQGEFYGLGEDIHAHTLPDRGCVLTCFNLTEQPVTRPVSFTAAEVGLKTFDGLALHGCAGALGKRVARLQVRMPARGVAVVQLVR